jgi:hypothetical protein
MISKETEAYKTDSTGRIKLTFTVSFGIAFNITIRETCHVPLPRLFPKLHLILPV